MRVVTVAVSLDVGVDTDGGCGGDDCDKKKEEHENGLSLGFRGNVDLTEAPLLVFDYVYSSRGIIAAQSHCSARTM